MGFNVISPVEEFILINVGKGTTVPVESLTTIE